MLKIIHNFNNLNFTELMAVYFEGNQENGKCRYCYEPDDVQLRKAEEDFYAYLVDVFFQQADSFYCVLEEQGRYIAALRLEPYREGYLLCALETLPEERNHGYASKLIRLVQQYLSQQGEGVVYSHVSKRNMASLTVHQKCGFRIIKDYAVYSDGSVLHSHHTLEYKYKKSEI